MWTPQSMLSILTFSFFISTFVQIANSSVFNLFGSRPLAIPRSHEASKPRSLMIRSNETWPAFPFTVTIDQKSSTPEWLRFSYGGQSGTYQQSIILSSLIGNLSATFARSPTDILNDMSTVSNQDVYVLFTITPRSLDAKSFSLALDKLAASVQQWGAKEMDFVIGSGPQNTTAEGVFQVRLGRGIFTAGTGISTSLPFSTLSIAPTSPSDATSAPMFTATRVSSGLIPVNNSTAAGHSTNAMWGSSRPVLYLSSQAAVSANQSMAQSTKVNSSASNIASHYTVLSALSSGPAVSQSTKVNSSTMVASTIKSHYTVLSALNSGAAVSQSYQGSSASGSAALPARNITGYLFSTSAPSSSSGVTSSPILMSRSIASTGFGSLNMSVRSTQCSAGLCPPRTQSSQPVIATTTTGSLPSSFNATISKVYSGGVGNIVPLGGGSTSGTGLASTATALAALTSNAIANSSIPVSSSAVLSSSALFSVASSSQSSSITGSSGSSSPVAQSSSSNPGLLTTSSPAPGPVLSSSGTATVNSQSAVVGLGPVEASVAANKNQGNKDNNFNGLCPGILCPVCPGCLAGVAAGEYPGPAAAGPLGGSLGSLGNALDSGADPNGNNDPNKPRTGDNLSITQASRSQTATLASSTVFPSSTVASSSFGYNTSTVYSSSSIVSHTVSSNISMTSQSPSSSCSACAICQGFSFGAGFPTSDDVVDDDRDQGDWIDQKRGLAGRDIASGKLTGRSHPGRALAGRLFLEERKAPLAKRAGNFGTKTHLGACSVTPFTNKPKYPEATNVKKFEGAAGAAKQGAADYAAFFATATYWAVPSNRPKGDCRVPDWSWNKTAELGNVIDPISGKGWVVGGKGDSEHVNIDHVYEAHFLYEFFEDLLSPGGGLGLKQFTCDDVDNILDIPDKQDTNNPQGTRLNTLFNMLANFEHPEFIGMDQKMNELKERITHAGPFGPDQPLPFAGTDPRSGLSRDPATDMSNLAKICIVLDMLNTPKAVELFTLTHARIYNALTIITDLPSYYDFDRSRHGRDLGYIVYMAERFDARNAELQSIYNSVVGALPTKQLAYWDEYKSSFTSRYPVASMTLPMDNIGYRCRENIKIGKRQGSAIACPVPTDYGAKKQRTAPNWSPGPPRTGTGVPSKGAFGNSGALNGAPVATSNGTGMYPQHPPTITTPPLTSMTSVSSMASTMTSPVVMLPISSLVPPASSPIPPASVTPLAPASAPANPDSCGPAQQQPAANFFDTCSAKVNLVSTPSQYGVMCQSYGTTSISYDSCATSYKVMCKNLASSSWTETDEWVWLQEKGCAVGVYIPSSAKIPSQSHCEKDIFKAMVDSCHTTLSISNLASVNIAQWPSFTGKTQTGQQVKFGYPSYMIAPAQPAGLGIDANGWTTGSLGGEASANELPSGDNLTPGQIAGDVKGTGSGISSRDGGSPLHVARCPPGTCYVYCVCQ